MGWSSIFWVVAICFYGYWLTDTTHKYFFLSEAQNVVGFKGALPKPLPEEVHHWFAVSVIKELFDKDSIRYLTIRAHIVSAGLLGWMMILQAVPQIRNRWIWFHKLIGKLIFPLMLVHWIVNGYVFFVMGLIDGGAWTGYYLIISWCISLVSYPLGLFYVNKKDIKKHRTWMTVTIACMFVVPTQRFLWLVTSTNGLFGPYKTPEFYKEFILGGTSFAAFIVNTAAGVYFAFLSSPHTEKPKAG
eukprot:TRINITY_DN8187_c0_g1_i3.p1 TRINITY_DN8187_c0_g1~~TRINITY_DN8187_c0_g1_i3.p1  ORF type:complete len:244 (-),score=47.48 TRINITY_DN8187_c0_g1_i3:116-847(-)